MKYAVKIPARRRNVAIEISLEGDTDSDGSISIQVPTADRASAAEFTVAPDALLAGVTRLDRIRAVERETAQPPRSHGQGSAPSAGTPSR